MSKSPISPHDGAAGKKNRHPLKPAFQELALVAAFAARLRRWRKRKHILLKQMAREMGVSIAVVSAWEKGTRFPSVAHLEQLSAYTGILACQLLYSGRSDCRQNSSCQCPAQAKPYPLPRST